MASNDPDFETKAADIIGLYLNPPAHAAVSASMKKRPSRPWIAKIWCCRSRWGEPNGTALRTRDVPFGTPVAQIRTGPIKA